MKNRQTVFINVETFRAIKEQIQINSYPTDDLTLRIGWKRFKYSKSVQGYQEYCKQYSSK